MIPNAALLVLTACAAPLPGFAEPQQHAEALVEFTPMRFGDGDEYTYDQEFFPGAHYDLGQLDPAELLGQPVGSRLARHEEVVQAFESWAATSDRLQLSTYGRTYEGRPLLRAVISSEANLARLDELRDAMARLADPRGLSEGDGEQLMQDLPAVAWMGYSVHGDELSGVDAALALAHHLIASTDADVAALLDDVIIVMDPCMNPDGRMRIVSQIEQSFGYVQNLDYASMHRGRWPGGRGNHYLFDMNRDWMTGIAPETRGRWRAVLELPPQLFVDAHEMSGLDTFLFYPQAQPHSGEYSAHVQRWQSVLADAAGAAFDAFGWGYYTREWADAWYPAYSDFFGTLNGAIGMLFEQGSTDGQALLRASGEVVAYRASVHGQIVASLANLTALAKHRDEILRGYLAERRRNVSDEQVAADRMFVAREDGSGRLERLVRTLTAQGVEVERTTAAFSIDGATDVFGRVHDELGLPIGSIVVRVRQPQAPMVRAYLGFDPRMSREALEEERRQLERGEGSKMYDVTAWSLGRAFDLDCFWADGVAIEAERVVADSATWPGTVGTLEGGGIVERDRPATAYVVDGRSDRVPRFGALALERGLAVHVATEAFDAGGRAFPAGSLLLRRHENVRVAAEEERARFVSTLDGVAREAGVEVHGLDTLRSPGIGPDLGGGAFQLLERPRLAIVGGEGTDRSEFGHLWRFVDEELRTPASLLEAGSLGNYDLRRFNVIVLPSGAGSAALDAAGELGGWVEAGGTLIAMGSSAGALAGSELSDVVRRRDALDRLETFAWLVDRERAARQVSVDLAELYDGVTTQEQTETDADLAAPGIEAPDAKAGDAWARRFAPAGVILRAERDRDHWLNAGARADELPVFFSGSTALLAPEGVTVPVRLGAQGELRLGGLLWPEAEARIADSAWATVERRGAGQVILFADSPVFRGFWHGTARLLANALVLGPGAGASPAIGR